MSRFGEELKLIPPVVKGIAVSLYLVVAACLLYVTSLRDPGGQRWPLWASLVFSVGIPLVALIYVLLVGYVYQDARRRGMRYVMWTLLAIFIPNAIGFILYFILREPLLRRCSQCGARM